MPISRILFSAFQQNPYHLSAARVTPLPVTAYPPAWRGLRSYAGLLGLSTRKVYPHGVLPHHTVGSYPTFSPFP